MPPSVNPPPASPPLLTDGTMKCWGYNGYGQLGDGTTTQRTTPVEVSGLILAPRPLPLRPCTCCERSMKSFGFSVGAEDCDPEL